MTKNTSNEKSQEYPSGVDIQIPPTSSGQEFLRFLEEQHKNDTLRSFFINVDGERSVPAYKLYYYLLTKEFNWDILGKPLAEYKRGYLDEIDMPLTPPYIDTPEARKSQLIGIISTSQGFPISSVEVNGRTMEFPDSAEFYKYGRLIAFQRKAWDAVLQSRGEFSEFFGEGHNKGEILNNVTSDILHHSLTPMFHDRAIELILTAVNGYFSVDDHAKLEQLLKNVTKISTRLIFLDNGNRLADLFRKVFEAGYVTHCDKKELGEWMQENFQFRFRKQLRAYTKDYIEKCISRNFYPCKHPLVVLEKGHLLVANCGGTEK